MLNLSDVVAGVLKNKVDPSFRGKNALYEELMWQEKAKIKGSPEYYQYTGQLIEDLQKQHRLVKEYNNLAWWKRLFKKPKSYDPMPRFSRVK